ncbi:MAG: hypothetical protein O3B76_05480 [Proteobacteria bacterium]|nr:hypothetical protein [Pseudomonadota bacterium]MDA1024092.1 hypothetical protein [Pseudomonadota bacterium]
MKRPGFFSAFFIAWMTTSPASAEGTVSAVSFLPLPENSSLFVRPMDNSDQNLALQKEFERVLKNKGYKVSKDAPLILTFETSDTDGSWTGGGPNNIVELSDNPAQTGVNAPQVRFNLFNSTRGGLLNPNRKERTRTVSPSTFRIDVTIDNKSDGKRLWQGWSAADLGLSSNGAVTRVMIPTIIDGLGKTVKQQSFPVQ